MLKTFNTGMHRSAKNKDFDKQMLSHQRNANKSEFGTVSCQPKKTRGEDEDDDIFHPWINSKKVNEDLQPNENIYKSRQNVRNILDELLTLCIAQDELYKDTIFDFNQYEIYL